jgi:hypothetical protein
MKKAEKNLKNEPTDRRSTGPDRSVGLKCGPAPDRPVAGTGSISALNLRNFQCF